MIRYRRDIDTTYLRATYTEETWESCTVDGRDCLRFVSYGAAHHYPLTGYEREAALAGWEAPPAFTYHAQLPT